MISSSSTRLIIAEFFILTQTRTQIQTQFSKMLINLNYLERLMSYLVKTSSGCYYFRIRIPKSFQHLYQNRAEIRKSLRTKDSVEASYLASTLSFQLKKSWSIQMSQMIVMQFQVITEFDKDQKITKQTAIVEPDKDQAQELKALETYTKSLQIKHSSSTQSDASSISQSQIQSPREALPDSTQKHQFLLFSDAISQYISEHQTRKSWSQSTLSDYASIFDKALKFLSDKPLDSYTRQDASSYIEHLKSQNLKPNSINKHITTLSGLFKYFVIHYDLPKNPFTHFQLKETERPDRKVRIYTKSELKTLFENLKYDPETPAYYWIPLIMLFSGMRPGEVAQLQKQHIIQIDNIYCFDLQNMRLKTKNSIRKIPIHQKLIDLGFLDYVNSIKTTRLFNELKDLSKDKPASAISQHWNRDFHTKFGLDITKKSLYSLRHNFETELRNNGIPESFAAEIVGHAKGQTMSYGLYAAPDQVQKLYEVVNTINYDFINFNPLQ